MEGNGRRSCRSRSWKRRSKMYYIENQTLRRRRLHQTLSIELIQKYSMLQEVAEHMAKSYGARAWEVCETIQPTGKRWPRFGNLLVDNYPYTDADVSWACKEYACTIEDVLSRRTRLAFLNKDAALDAIPVVADIMADELGWTAEVKKQQVEAAEKYVNTYGGRISVTSENTLKSGRYKSVHDIFNAIDRNQNGYLEKQEVEEISQILGFKLTDEEVDEAFREMDQKRFGRVSLDDFMKWWTTSSSSPFHKKLSKELGLRVVSEADLRNIGPGTMFG
eukprot:CAMPEP_0178765346 /NCGR_PEP_ID=MMETSP0744-20121128/18383_1 /TAXON_ID=913974 /ORGANISM="Nitzschia punctata, Strain CCMP561" /LENGTH=276 /DNA_ID=CAMNT_0020420797 /DNA_START=76 /DNA_END=906 /DNA_ORIENTATION=+